MSLHYLVKLVKFIRKTVYQTSTESAEFYRRYYKKMFWSFFLDTVYNKYYIIMRVYLFCGLHTCAVYHRRRHPQIAACYCTRQIFRIGTVRYAEGL